MHLPSSIRRASALLLPLLLAACGVPTEPRATAEAAAGKPAPVWPAPPAEPRIRWIGQIANPTDLDIRVPFLSRIGNFLTGGDRGREPLVRPFGVGVDETGNLCVTDPGAGAVCYYDLARHQYRRWTKAGAVPFDTPVAVAKRAGLIYVADSGRQEVVALDEQGRVQWRITEESDRPSGLALDGDRLYVACSNTHVMRVYDLQGHALSQFGGRGVEPGKFNFPTHVTADGRGNIYVTDAMNSRVQVFTRDGGYVRTIGSLGDGSGHFSRPKGIAVDSQGRIYVGDALFDNVQIFDRDGRFLLDFGAAGSQRGEFWLPAGLAIAPDGRIYVADSYNRRLQVFQYLATP